MVLKDNPRSIERLVAERIVDDALKAGYKISVRDGEAFTLKRSGDKSAIIEALCTTDEDYLYFSLDGQNIGWVWMVWGNEGDVISDYVSDPRIEALLKGAEKLADTLSE